MVQLLHSDTPSRVMASRGIIAVEKGDRSRPFMILARDRPERDQAAISYLLCRIVGSEAEQD